MIDFIGQPYRVVLRDTQTGEARICDPSMVWDEHDLFWWKDGNGGCDCNRETYFRKGTPYTEHGSCGEKRYTLEEFVFSPETPEEFHVRPEQLETP